MRNFLLVCGAVMPVVVAAQAPCTITLSGAISASLPCSVSVAKMADGYTVRLDQTQWSSGTQVTASFRMSVAPKPRTYGPTDLLSWSVACSNPGVRPGGWLATPSSTTVTTFGKFTAYAAGSFALTIASVGASFADVHGSLAGTLTYAPPPDTTSTAGPVTISATF
jgi:hypothetical protein